MISKRTNFRHFLWRWHRRIGLAIALLVLLLAVTGVLLNHANTLKLDSNGVPSWLLSVAYRIETPEITSFAFSDGWLSHIGGNHLYFNDQQLTYCRGDLTGVVSTDKALIAACGNELLLFTPQGNMIERINASYGLPQPINRLGLCDQLPCMLSGVQRFQIDVDQLLWQTTTATAEWSETTSIPDDYRNTLLNRYIGTEISWERLLLDLHSGRLLGVTGPWLMDLVAVMLIVLAASGFTTWYSAKRARRRK